MQGKLNLSSEYRTYQLPLDTKYEKVEILTNTFSNNLDYKTFMPSFLNQKLLPLQLS